jgi:cytochrome c5
MNSRVVWIVSLLVCLAGCGGDAGSSADPAKVLAPGELVYQRFCISCHASGVSGAPPFGNAQAWAPRIAKGDDAMLKSTIEGLPSAGMPPRGLCRTCTDQELLDAIHYMTSQSR